MLLLIDKSYALKIRGFVGLYSYIAQHSYFQYVMCTNPASSTLIF